MVYAAIDSAYHLILLLFQSQNKPGAKDSNKQESPGKENKTEDVLIKVVRVIANISINEVVGPSVAASHQCLDLLLSILGTKIY